MNAQPIRCATTARSLTRALPRRAFDLTPIALAALGTLGLMVLSATPAHAVPATPPTSGAYVTDPTQSHVEDATSQGLRLPNTVLCYVGATGVNQTEVVNQGNYLALVDQNKCENGGGGSGSGSSSSSGASSAPSYIRAAVNSSRVDDASPLLGKVWFEQDSMGGGQGGGGPGTIYAHLSATAAPTPATPYGTFHTDFCGVFQGSSSCDAMHGYAQGDGASVTAYQTGGGDDISMVLTGTTAAGQGRVQFGQTADWTFAYDGSFFRRSDGSSDQCFDRSFANADKTAWRYGVYDSTGARVERNGGFPIKSSGGVYGYVGYWGLWLQGNATLSDGATVTRFSYGNQGASSGDYTLVKKDGRLKKQEMHTSTLDAIKNVPFLFWVNSTFQDSANNSHPQGSNLEVKWDGSAFVITGVGQNGQTTPVAGSPTIPPSVLATIWNINGWSQALGGSVTIVNRNGTGGYVALGSASVVTYRTETVVTPGSTDWPTTLHCVSDCPVGGTALVNGLNNTQDASSAFATASIAQFGGSAQTANTRWNWQPVAVGSQVDYVASNGVLARGSDAVVWSSPVAPANPQYANSLQTGRLVDDAGLAMLACDANGNSSGSGYYCPNRLDGVSVVYVWETGPNSWSQFSGLKDSSGVMLQFDAPLALQYSVPQTGVSTTYANASLVLQYNGFGDLQGIPGKCVNPDTNAEVTCDNNGNNRWVSAFTIPEGGTVSDGTHTYFVKPLEEELRLKQVNGSNCAALTLPTIANAAMPGESGFTNPLTTNGTMPVLTGAPRVIQGAVQY
ncbi:MAG: hypothetical protein AB9M60_02835 [Leptothrix sp. (in: b-proteobacteria)]